MRLTCIAILFAALAASQPPPSIGNAIYKSRLDAIRTPPPGATKAEAVDQMLNEVQKILFTPDASAARYLNAIRTIRQSGASGSSSGSTSVTMLPLLSDVFGISLEQGSVIRTVSGSTVNFQVNPAGIICRTSKPDAPDDEIERCKKFWGRVNVALAFDQNRSNAPSGLVALRDQFSEARVHIDLFKQTQEMAMRGLVANLAQGASGAPTPEKKIYDTLISSLSTRAARIWSEVAATDEFKEWRKQARERLMAAPAERLEQEWSALRRELTGLIDARFPDHPGLNARGRAEFSSHWNSLLRRLARDAVKRSQFAFEAGVSRPDVATEEIAGGIVSAGVRPPSLVTARLIASRGFMNLTLAGNASASWFTEVRPGMSGHFREWQANGSAILRLREIPDWGAVSLAFGGLFGELRQRPLGIDFAAANPVSADSTKLNQPGWIRLFQTRLEVPTANRNVVIPFSFTYSNRTDLIKEEDVRASIGITVRFDGLFPSRGNP